MNRAPCPPLLIFSHKRHVPNVQLTTRIGRIPKPPSFTVQQTFPHPTRILLMIFFVIPEKKWLRFFPVWLATPHGMKNKDKKYMGTRASAFQLRNLLSNCSFTWSHRSVQVSQILNGEPSNQSRLKATWLIPKPVSKRINLTLNSLITVAWRPKFSINMSFLKAQVYWQGEKICWTWMGSPASIVAFFFWLECLLFLLFVLQHNWSSITHQNHWINV